MSALLKFLKSPIRMPGIKPRPKVKRAPWVLRIWPENKRNAAVWFFTFAGFIAHSILLLASMVGILFLPLIVAQSHPDAPIAAPVRWLRANFSKDVATIIYVVISFSVFVILNYTTMVFDYLCREQSGAKKQDTSSPTV
jgi:hypothetical protein